MFILSKKKKEKKHLNRVKVFKPKTSCNKTDAPQVMPEVFNVATMIWQT